MKSVRSIFRVFYLAVSLLVTACLPAHLDKYRNSGDKQSRASLSPANDTAVPASTFAEKVGVTNDRIPPPPAGEVASPSENAARATIYAIDRQTFRFALRDTDVWDTALNVLLRNYSLTIVDRQSGVIATEWDSYFLNSAVYRNKISMHIIRNSGGTTDLTIHNSVERLRDASQAAGTVGAVWLPASEPTSEVARLVQNMAIVLNQPPPVLPPNSAIAKDAPSSSPVSR